MLTRRRDSLGFYFILKKQVLLRSFVGGGEFQRPWDLSIQQMLPLLRTFTNEAEQILDLPRQQSPGCQQGSCGSKFVWVKERVFNVM